MPSLKERVNGSPVWVAALLGAFVTLLASHAASYAAFFRDSVPRSDISVMIQKESPYVKDQSLILETLKDIKAALHQIQYGQEDG